MIIKSSEFQKINLDKYKIILLYGKNNGFKNQVINFLKKNQKEISNFDERDILENENQFLENMLSKSLFADDKLIILRRVSEKILRIINELESRNVNDKFIIVADNLEKKSKLRSYFEKSTKYSCIPFYPDNDQTLSILAKHIVKEKNIKISQANINLIISKSSGDREALLNEFEKIEHFKNEGKPITAESVSKLINLHEDHNISDLINNCLAKNLKKTTQILNENNFSNEDCILIIRLFLNKAKKIFLLSSEFKKNKNIDVTISAAKPPIFWKDKEITKKQIYNWKPENVKELIYKINKTELLIKKNYNNPIYLINNFILEQSSNSNN